MTPNKTQLLEFVNDEIDNASERIGECNWPIEIDSAKREREYLKELLVIVQGSDHD